MASMTVRAYRPADAPALLELFRDTVRRVNSRDYDPLQIRAWASEDILPQEWAERFQGRFVLVAEQAGKLIGFTDLEPNGHIDRFYVSADHQRQGVGALLLNAVIKESQRRKLSRLFVEVSITAKPFFESFGFVRIEQQTVLHRGVEFINFRMQRDSQMNSEPKENS